MRTYFFLVHPYSITTILVLAIFRGPCFNFYSLHDFRYQKWPKPSIFELVRTNLFCVSRVFMELTITINETFKLWVLLLLRYLLGTYYLVYVLWCQRIKLIQVVSTSEFHEYWWKDIDFIFFVPSIYCRASVKKGKIVFENFNILGSWSFRIIF